MTSFWKAPMFRIATLAGVLLLVLSACAYHGGGYHGSRYGYGNYHGGYARHHHGYRHHGRHYYRHRYH